ncbi:MAG: peptide deformylase [Halobacteriovoraceae bacterium]|nr:peptide deformylase [Halobacteriovoraceae bacterium]|tara:strand:- start:28612 stop:29202 length:591 start_codon:yes stop_codon:yes gene_type:complete
MTEKFLENYKLEGESLPIKTYPDPVLTKVAEEVTVFDQELQTLCKNMLYTMYKAPGIGLAAPQIGVSKRIFVIDVDYERDETEEDSGEYLLSEFNPRIFINPTFKEKVGETTYQEGCLSLPGIYEDIKRFESIVVEYNDVNGELKTMDADGLLSICIQHENDHLDGIVMIDRMSKLKKSFFKKKLIKAKKEASHNL